MQFWQYVKKHNGTQFVDPTYAQLLEELRANGHLVLALTARALDLTESTLLQLGKLGIDFGPLDSIEIQKLKDVPNVIVVNSQIVFSPADGDWKSTKGLALLRLLKVLQERNSVFASFYQIYFFDDNENDIKAVNLAFEKSGLSPNRAFTVHSFAAKTKRANDRLAPYFEIIGEIQQEALERRGVYLSNEQALELHLRKLNQCRELFKF